MNRGSPYTRSLKHIPVHLFVFKYQLTKKWLFGPQKFESGAFKKQAPGLLWGQLGQFDVFVWLKMVLMFTNV